MTTDSKFQQALPQAQPQRSTDSSDADAERRADEHIASLVGAVLGRISFAREGRIQAQVQAGWVTLTGELERQYQRQVADEAVHFIVGVVGVDNRLVVKP